MPCGYAAARTDPFGRLFHDGPLRRGIGLRGGSAGAEESAIPPSNPIRPEPLWERKARAVRAAHAMPIAFKHQPVLFHEVMEWIRPKAGGVYLDGTLGGGGHSEGILAAAGGTATLYGIDRDLEAIAAATERLIGYPGFHAIHGNFHDARALLAAAGAKPLDGALVDLGVSSHQLDSAERGFSYHEDAPLDMRMDASGGQTAAEYLATVSPMEFRRVLTDYGEERWAARIAQVLEEKRRAKPLRTTLDLVAVVDAAIPRAVRRKDEGHPARRTFQAVRIALNDELAPLEQALTDMVDLLAPGGRLLVITFHSLEDRIAKNTLRRLQNPCVCPPKAPVCTCGKLPLGRVLGGGAIKPSQEETDINPRARSAKLRVFERAEAEPGRPVNGYRPDAGRRG